MAPELLPYIHSTRSSRARPQTERGRAEKESKSNVPLLRLRSLVSSPHASLATHAAVYMCNVRACSVVFTWITHADGLGAVSGLICACRWEAWRKERGGRGHRRIGGGGAHLITHHHHHTQVRSGLGSLPRNRILSVEGNSVKGLKALPPSRSFVRGMEMGRGLSH